MLSILAPAFLLFLLDKLPLQCVCACVCDWSRLTVCWLSLTLLLLLLLMMMMMMLFNKLLQCDVHQTLLNVTLTDGTVTQLVAALFTHCVSTRTDKHCTVIRTHLHTSHDHKITTEITDHIPQSQTIQQFCVSNSPPWPSIQHQSICIKVLKATQKLLRG